MDREAIIEAIVAFVGVASLAIAIIWIGSTYELQNQSEGGVALIAALAAFIVLMLVVGLFLSRRQ